MEILQKPTGIKLSGNLSDILLTSQSGVDITLYYGDKLVLEERFYPDMNGQVRIEIAELIDGLLSVVIPPISSGLQLQSSLYGNFKIELVDIEDQTDSEEVEFSVLKAGIDGELETEAFLLKNFLTWQPQQKVVKMHDLEWLTYYALLGSTVKIKGYFAGQDPVEVIYLILSQGAGTTFSTKYSKMLNLFSDIPKYIDVWIEQNDIKVSYVQRYILSSELHEYDDVFVFANTLGGVDTIRFTGELQENHEYKFENALFDRSTIDYYVEPNPVFTKNSGHFRSERERVWSLEFFSSLQKFHFSNGKLKQIRVTKHTLESVAGNLSDYNFDFTWTEQTKYRNLTRLAELPEIELPEEDPENPGSGGAAGGIVKILDQNDTLVTTVEAPGQFKVLAFDGIAVNPDSEAGLQIIVNPD